MKNTNDNFLSIINDITINKDIQELKKFKHHYGSTRFEHCLSVSYYSYIICKFLHLDYISASRAGLLHDLFFYDSDIGEKPKFHIWKHPKIALNNAKNLFTLNDKECDMILNHMWPITLRPPKYIESYIISFVDKYCATVEFFKYLTKKYKLRMVYRYAYIFLTILFIRF